MYAKCCIEEREREREKCFSSVWNIYIFSSCFPVRKTWFMVHNQLACCDFQLEMTFKLKWVICCPVQLHLGFFLWCNNSLPPTYARPVLTCREMPTILSPAAIKFAFSLRKEFSMTKVRPFQNHYELSSCLIFNALNIKQIKLCFVLQENSWYQRIDRWIKSDTVRIPEFAPRVSKTELNSPLFHLSPPLSALHAYEPVYKKVTHSPGVQVSLPSIVERVTE